MKNTCKVKGKARLIKKRDIDCSKCKSKGKCEGEGEGEERGFYNNDGYFMRT